jgi:hypothetical protein
MSKGSKGESKVYVMVGNGRIRVSAEARVIFFVWGSFSPSIYTHPVLVGPLFYGTERYPMVRSDKLEAEGWRDLSDGPRVGWSDVSRTSLRGSSISSSPLQVIVTAADLLR